VSCQLTLQRILQHALHCGGEVFVFQRMKLSATVECVLFVILNDIGECDTFFLLWYKTSATVRPLTGTAGFSLHSSMLHQSTEMWGYGILWVFATLYPQQHMCNMTQLCHMRCCCGYRVAKTHSMPYPHISFDCKRAL